MLNVTELVPPKYFMSRNVSSYQFFPDLVDATQRPTTTSHNNGFIHLVT